MRSPGSLFAAVLFATLSVRAASIRHYEANIVPLAIAQDREGFLWIATSDGLLRFDGVHYEHVRAPAARDLDVSPGGSVWLATDKGLVRYDHGSLTRELAGHDIQALIVTAAGRLLAASDGDLYIAAEPDSKPVHWTSQKRTSVHGRFQTDLEGNTWFGCGLYLCVWSDDDVRQIAAGDVWHHHRRRSPSDPSATAGRQWDWADIVSTPDRRIWARNGPEVIEYSGGRSIGRTLPVESFHGVRPGFLLDRSGRLWIPGRQLHVVDKGKLEVFHSAGAPLNDVTTMFQDRRGTLWFGLAGKGLAALSDDATLQSWAEPEGISGSVLDLSINPRLGLLASTNTGGYVFDAVQSRWRAIAHESLRVMLADADGSILSVRYAGGLWDGNREIPLPGNLNPRRIRRLYRDTQGTLWIASTDGLFRLDPPRRITEVPLPHNGLYPSEFDTDGEGRLWVGYEGGVAVCANGNCSQAIGTADGLADPRIRTIAVRAGEVWVGYRASIGFTRFVRKAGAGGWVATQFSPENGYGPVDTHFLRRDSRGWMWRGSTDGVYVSDGVHTQPEDWLHLTFGDAVNWSYANMYGWLERPDGSVWIGTQKGVVRLHPSADWFPGAPPRVSPLPSLRAHQDVEIHLSHPGQPPFQSRLFRYRLLPADKQWRFNAGGTVRYAKLPAGSYRFEVAAGAGRPSLTYDFAVEGNGWLFWSIGIAGGLLLGVLAWAAARWRRFHRSAVAAEDYWKQKREFLEGRDSDETASPEPADDWSGRSLDGRFLLQKRIACGGFAAVYRALDQSNGGKPVAVKLLHPLRDNERWRRRRFVDEVTVLQTLHDPGIVEIRYAGEAAPDRPYLVMEFIEGLTLRALLDEGQMELERAANLLEQIGHALAAAHRAGILHRDLKPENIMIRDAAQAGERIQLIDFGIASLVEEQTSDHTTKLAGSPGYLAPERWVGLASCRSDIYSLAAIAAEMLAGVPLGELGFCAGDPAAFRQRMLSLRPSLPHAALDLLMAALSYDPEARPSDVQAFTRELSQSLVDASPIRS